MGNSKLQHYGSVALCSARLALQRQCEYPMFLASWLVGIPVQYLSGVWLLKVMVERFQPLAGWTFPQIAFLYGLALFSHGLAVIFFVQTWFIGHQVVYGGFDRLLLRPMNVFFQFMVQYVNLIGLIDLVPASMVFLYGCHALGFAWSPGNAGKLLLVVLGATLIRTAIYTVIGSSAFWTRSPGSYHGAVETLLHQGALYPLSVYPLLFQWALTFLLPVGFISFYPACEFVGQSARTSLPLGLALWTPVIGLLSFTAAHTVFRFGLSRYEGSGS